MVGSKIFENFKNTYKDLRVLENHPIAYFCAEFALTDSLPIYSGGLGVLAGDVIREADDFGLPLIGIGLLYKQGYFKQVITQSGMQDELPAYNNTAILPIERLHDNQYEPLKIHIHLGNREVAVQLWQYWHGSIRVILLDTDLEENQELDRRLTLSLYPSDSDWRIQQEIILGIGGVKALKALNIDPAVYHMNEGHSAFAILEIAHQIVKHDKLPFEEGLNRAKNKTVFTNHTLIPSGNDMFHKDQVNRLLSSYADHLGLPVDQMIQMGRVSEGSEFFSMTHLALSASKITSAVSKTHAQFASISWPEFKLVPVTNGVHRPTWQDERFQKLGEKVTRGLEVSDGSIFRAHQDLKERLCEFVVSVSGREFDPEILTITWSRRIAAYKQPKLLFSDIERLKKLVHDEQRPLQILIAGKAHPGDTDAKQMISEILSLIHKHDLGNRVVFLPNYTIEMAKLLVSGSDVWCNTPERGKEACGTSGMKAGMNGVLQAAISDGWTDEIDLHNVGFSIDPQNSAESFYQILEKEIVPLYYTRSNSGIPINWVSLMRKTIASVENQFSAERMLTQYIEKLYIPVVTDAK